MLLVETSVADKECRRGKLLGAANALKFPIAGGRRERELYAEGVPERLCPETNYDSSSVTSLSKNAESGLKAPIPAQSANPRWMLWHSSRQGPSGCLAPTSKPKRNDNTKHAPRFSATVRQVAPSNGPA